jgi:hypothetical protein
MNILQIVISALVSAMVTIILGVIIKRPLERRADYAEQMAADERKKQEAVMIGIQAMLRDRLLEGFRHYDDQGYAEYDDRSNIDNMYHAYHNLGKNGVMDKMYEKFMQLPEHGGVTHENV